MTNIYLRPGRPSPNNVRLSDPTSTFNTQFPQAINVAPTTSLTLAKGVASAVAAVSITAVTVAGSFALSQLVAIVSASTMSLANAVATRVLIVSASTVTLVRSTQKLVAAISSSTVAMAKGCVRTVLATCASSVTVLRGLALLFTVAIGAVTSSNVLRSIGKAVKVGVFGSLKLSSFISKLVAVGATGTVIVSKPKNLLKTLTIISTSSAVVLKRAGKAIATTVGSSLVMHRGIGKIVGVIATTVANFLKRISSSAPASVPLTVFAEPAVILYAVAEGPIWVIEAS